MVAVNSSPIIWLSQIKQFDLLRQVFDTVVMAPTVYEETVTRAAGYPNASNVTVACASGWMRVIAPTDVSRVAVLQA